MLCYVIESRDDDITRGYTGTYTHADLELARIFLPHFVQREADGKEPATFIMGSPRGVRVSEWRTRGY